MSTLYGAHTQALGFSYTGQKPTFPESGLTPSSSEWKSTDIMPREWAYNSADDIWYYNTGTEIKAFSGSSTEETISIETTALYDATKEEDSGGYAYYAGSDFVVYSNIDSTDEDFQEEQIYLCIESALTGESPETNPEKWEAQGDEVTVSTSGASTLFYDSTSDIQTITDYINGNNTIDISTGIIYEYQTTATTGLQPNDNSETTGRWVEVGSLNYASDDISLSDTENQSLSEEATDVSGALEEIKTAILAIRESVSNIAYASITVEADATPLVPTTTETILSIVDLVDSTNTDIIESDETNNYIALKAIGSYQFVSFLVVENSSNATEYSVTIRVRDYDTDDLLNTRTIIVNNGDIDTNTVVVPLTITEETNVKITVEATSDTALTIDTYQTTLTADSVAGSAGHIIVDTDGNELTAQTKLKFTSGLTAENDNVNGQTIVSVDGLTTSDIVESNALENIGTEADVSQATINSNIDSRLFEQIAFSLTGYGEDVTTTSQDITIAPYTFTAKKLAVYMGTAPTGSSAIVTFYHNGTSIGTVTIAASGNTGSTTITDESVTENDTLSAVVTQIGLTIAGATVKAYIQGIKTQ
jgi:hypothetical protein